MTDTAINPRLAAQIDQYVDLVLSVPPAVLYQRRPIFLPRKSREELLEEVARHALAHPSNLNMRSWHGECGTTHCIAGWAVHLAGAKGYELEAYLGKAWAGFLLLGRQVECHFYDSDSKARRFLQSVLDRRNSSLKEHST